MKLLDLMEAKPVNGLAPKKIPDGYKEGKMCWAVVEVDPTYGDTVIESGFDTKRDALAWIKAQNESRRS